MTILPAGRQTCGMYGRAVLALFLLLYHDSTVLSESNKCDAALGLADGTIPDSSFTSSVSNSTPEEARLNGNGSWCFLMPLDPRKEVTITIDLGENRLVSGVQTQGPPLSLYNKTYYYHIGFKLLSSTNADAEEWVTCCDRDMQFLASDSLTQANVITTHPLPSLLLVRHLRFRFITDIRSIGNSTKCLRLEVLGCPRGVEPTTSVELEVEPSGWVVAMWRLPLVLMPLADGSLTEVNLTASNYIVQLHRSGGGEESLVVETRVQALRYMRPAPLWGAMYNVSLVCVYQGINMTCGSNNIEAVLEVCDSEVVTCSSREKVVFRAPSKLQAAVVGQEEVELSWSTDAMGWLTPTMALRITPTNGANITKEKILDQNDNRTIMSGVEEGNVYTVSFLPQAGTQRLAKFDFELYIIAWADVKLSPLNTGYGAFVANVELAADIIWNGTLRLTWVPANVVGVYLDKNTAASTGGDEIDAAQYEEAASAGGTAGWSFGVAAPAPRKDVNSTPEDAAWDADNTTEGSGTTESVGITSEDDIVEEEERGITIMGSAQESPASGVRVEGTAFMYTVVVTAEGVEDWSENVTEGSSMMVRRPVGDEEQGEVLMGVEMPQLTFLTEYQVNLTCHFGPVTVQCGTTKTYTALPLLLTKMDGMTVVYTVLEGRAGWQQQEARCHRGEGTLVSLPTHYEADLLRDALLKTSSVPLLDTYWLGLNMCPDYTGSVWSDGSIWHESLLSSTNAQLSSTTCCVKANWDKYQYIWTGEVCGALLPAVCEFHPHGMVEVVKDLKRGPANVTSASVSWTYMGIFWTPDILLVSYCPFRNLKNILTDAGNISKSCHTSQLEAAAVDLLQTGLLPYTEYYVNVTATIQQIGFTGAAVSTYVRTYPQQPVVVSIDTDGYVNIVWAQKVAEFGENDTVWVTMSNSTHPDVIMYNGTMMASGTILGDMKLQLGANYTVILKEMYGKKRKETVTLLAYPTCDCEGCQVDGWCFVTLQDPVNEDTAIEKCKGSDTSLATVGNVREVDLLLDMALALDDDLWVSHTSRRLQASNTEDGMQGLDNTTQASTGKVNVQPIECLVVSRAQRAVVVEQCTNTHSAACSHKISVGKAFSSLTTSSGPDWITMAWDQDSFKWEAKFAVRYQRSKEKRYKRALQWMSFSASPVTVSQLLPETAYTLELEADLGENVLSTSQEFEVVTTNFTEKTEDETQTSKLVVTGLSSLTENQVLHLVCNALLVAACITTMLFFFATGMFYQDCVAQLGFQSAVMAAYLNLLLAHPTQAQPEYQTGCIVVAVVLHFLFLCAFMFLMLEALTIAHLLVIHIRSPFQKSNWLMMAFGLVVPVVVVGISAAFLYSYYPDYSVNNCWLNPLGPAVWTEVVPIGILVIATVVFLMNTLCTAETSPELIEVDLRGRQSDSNKLRWVVLALTVELTTVWGLGVAYYQYHEEGTYFAFCVVTLILALTIVLCRTCFDDTFRSKMHRLCCGTELTYKRSEILSISARSRVYPSTGTSATGTSSVSGRMITPVGSKPPGVDTHQIPAASGSTSAAGRITPSAERATSSQGRTTPSGDRTTPSGGRGKAIHSEGRHTPDVGTTIFPVRSITPPLCRPTPNTSPKSTTESLQELLGPPNVTSRSDVNRGETTRAATSLSRKVPSVAPEEAAKEEVQKTLPGASE